MNKQKEYSRSGIRRCSVLILAVLLLTLSTVQAAPPEPYLVKDIYPGTGSSSPYYLTNVNGTLFFGADDGSHGRELWALVAGYQVYLPLALRQPNG